ncbi:MAG: PASTA domain-containing protein [Spirochaetales bacterium]|uniref:PASTA domain-containing protein n=1 Tax=Candidatus Thalassospirochaeta sargassi TaxID=3119039 RepID=A0AAJ1IHM8_9SPIO|nr:PASTA domain-containing protein [Spirochaetales bacterium]
MGPLGEKLKNLLFGGNTDPDRRFYRTFMVFAIGTIIIMIIAGLTTFFLSLKGVEQTMVPDITGIEIENALVELEEKALYSSVQLRYTQNIEDKGLVVGQDPAPGTSVRAGSRVVLKVSKGSAVEKLDDYVGWNINDLEAHIKSMVSIYGPLLSIKEPVTRVYDNAATGTILAQRPEPGTDITAATEIELVVSKGPMGQNRKVLDYTDLTFGEVLESVAKSNIRFVFTTKPAGRNDVPGTVVSQSPAADAVVPNDTIMQFVIAAPDNPPEGYVFGILERTLPDYQVPVTLDVAAITPDGERKELFSMKHAGGLITIPYLEEENTLLKVSVAGKEIITYAIRAVREE